MSIDLAYLLLKLSLAMSGAVALSALLRKPLRYAIGARAAYWLWLLVPVSAAAVLLPAPTQPIHVLRQVLSKSEGLSHLIGNAQMAASASGDYAAPALWLWAFGAVLAAALVARGQLRFLRQLGPLQQGPDGACRSVAISGPMLVGTWRPRVVLPADFDARYNAEERELVLAHEHAHLRRKDALMNAVAAATLCLNWFNPLLHWALGRFRFDQELACDADVLANLGSRRRSYAAALMKTQVASDSSWLVPVGCHWQPTHPLKERIAMLKRPLPGSTRRRVGVGLLIGVIGTAGYACWAAQPATRLAATGLVAAQGAPIAVHVKWSIDEAETAAEGSGAVKQRKLVLVSDLIANSGQIFSLYAPSSSKRTYQADCTAYAGTSGHEITLNCVLNSHGQVVGTPSIVAEDGVKARVKLSDTGNKNLFELEFNASTTPERIAAAEHEGSEDADHPPEPPDPPDAPDADDDSD